jgi:hypothetical protein
LVQGFLNVLLTGLEKAICSENEPRLLGIKFAPGWESELRPNTYKADSPKFKKEGEKEDRIEGSQQRFKPMA